jgi:hypothetical protein
MELWASSGTKIIEKPKSASTPPPAVVVPVANAPVAPLGATLASGTTPYSAPPQGPQSHSYPPVAMASTYPAPPVIAATPKKTNWLLWLAAASLVGLFGLVAVGGGVAYYYYQSVDDDTAELDKHVQSQVAANQGSNDNNDTTTTDHRQANNDTTTTDDNDTINTAPAHTTMIVVAPPSHVNTTTTTSTPVVTTHTTTNTTTNTAPAKPAAKKGDGTLQTFAAGKGQPVYVDGTQVGVGGTRIKTSCGMHQIAVGTAKAKIVDVPCDGTITVGSPDGS